MPRFKGAGSAAIKPVSSDDLEKARKAAEEKRQQEMLIAEERRRNAEASPSQQDPINENSTAAPPQEPVQENIGNAPAMMQPVQDDFGNAPAMTQPVQGDFGNAPAMTQPVQDDFGNAPTMTQPVQDDFGNAPAMTQPVQDDFGNAPALTQPVQDDFGNAPAMSQPVQDDFGNAPAMTQPAQDDFGNAPAMTQPVQDDFGNDAALPPLPSAQPVEAEEDASAADALPGLDAYMQPEEEESVYTPFDPFAESEPAEVPQQQTVAVDLNRFEEPEASEEPEEAALPPIVTPEQTFTQEAEPVQEAVPAAAQRVRQAAPPPPPKAEFSLNTSLFEVEDEDTQPEEPDVQPFANGLENLVMDFYDPETLELPEVSADMYCSLPRGAAKAVKPEAWVQACESLHMASANSLQRALTGWIEPRKALLNGPRILSPQGTERYGISEMIQDERVITYLQGLEAQLWKDTIYRSDGTEAPDWIHHTWLTKLLDYTVDYYMSTMR